MQDKQENSFSYTIENNANQKDLAGNLGENVPNETDNVLRMGAAALTGMGAESQVADMSSGGNSIMAIGGSEGYTGDDTSGGGADPYGDEEAADGETGKDLAREEGYDREADGGGGAGLGAGGLRRGENSQVDTSVAPGGLGTNHDK